MMLELTHQRREVERPQRVDRNFPATLRAETIYSGIRVRRKHRGEAGVSNVFGEIFWFHKSMLYAATIACGIVSSASCSARKSC